jgi:endonuclease III
MWKAARGTLEDIVALVGPYRDQRLLGLRKGVGLFRLNPQLTSAISGPVPAALRALKGMPQMGEAGAYRMLLFAGGQSVLPVDARVARVATRLGYGEKSTNFSKMAKSIRQAVAPELPATGNSYRQAYLYFEHHGATICTETDPGCGACPLLSDCPYRQSR